MNLYEKIIAIYPQLEIKTDEDRIAFKSVISLRNYSDGRGDLIDSWNHPTLPRPTQEQLDAAGS